MEVDNEPQVCRWQLLMCYCLDVFILKSAAAVQVNNLNWEKDKDLWFDDGNIVLVTGARGFRVYRGILTRASVVFQDLFKLPQPAHAETFEGCPVVRLHDSAKDMSRLFTILYNGARCVYIFLPDHHN